jgi:hypothetical protein
VAPNLPGAEAQFLPARAPGEPRPATPHFLTTLGGVASRSPPSFQGVDAPSRVHQEAHTLGFVVGIICLFLLVGVVRRRHWRRGWPGAGGHRRGFGPRAVLRRILRRIDATPAQEVLRDEAATLWEAACGLRGGLEASGRGLASALREEALDRRKPESAYRRQDEIRRS